MPALRKKVRRRRKKISCLNCRQKKLKCDKCLPCSRCKERELEASCVYENNYEAPYSKDDVSFMWNANQHINDGFNSNDDEKFHFYRPLVLFNMIQKCARARGIPVETLFSSITISGIEDAASYLKVLPPLHIADLMVDLYIERFDSVFPIIERDSVKDTVRCLYNSPPIFPVVGRLELLFVVLWASLKVEKLPSSLLEYLEQTGDSVTGLAERFRQKIDILDNLRTNLRHLADINFFETLSVQAYLSFLFNSPHYVNKKLCTAIYYGRSITAHQKIEDDINLMEKYSKLWSVVTQIDAMSSIFFNSPPWIQFEVDGSFIRNREDTSDENEYYSQKLFGQILKVGLQMWKDQHLSSVKNFTKKLEDYNVLLSQLSLQVMNCLDMAGDAAETFRFNLFKALLLKIRTTLYLYYPYADSVESGCYDSQIKVLGSLCLKKTAHLISMFNESKSFGWRKILTIFSLEGLAYIPFCALRNIHYGTEPLDYAAFLLDDSYIRTDPKRCEVLKSFQRFILLFSEIKEDDNSKKALIPLTADPLFAWNFLDSWLL